MSEQAPETNKFSQDVIDITWLVATASIVAWRRWEKAADDYKNSRDKNGRATEFTRPRCVDMQNAKMNFDTLSDMASRVMGRRPNNPFGETTPYPATPVEELHEMQDQFSAILGVDPELLRGLELCGTCGGFNHRWEDVTSFDMGEHHDIGNSAQEYQEYRHQIAENTCDACEGSGFEDGSWRFSPDEWVTLSQSKINPTA